MFNFGFVEMLALLAIAFLALGPEKFPAAMRSFLRLINELRGAFGEVKKEISAAAEDAKRQISESEKEIKKLTEDPLSGFSSEGPKTNPAFSDEAGRKGGGAAAAPSGGGPPFEGAGRQKPPPAARGEKPGKPAGPLPAPPAPAAKNPPRKEEKTQ